MLFLFFCSSIFLFLVSFENCTKKYLLYLCELNDVIWLSCFFVSVLYICFYWVGKVLKGIVAEIRRQNRKKSGCSNMKNLNTIKIFFSSFFMLHRIFICDTNCFRFCFNELNIKIKRSFPFFVYS